MSLQPAGRHDPAGHRRLVVRRIPRACPRAAGNTPTPRPMPDAAAAAGRADRRRCRARRPHRWRRSGSRRGPANPGRFQRGCAFRARTTASAAKWRFAHRPRALGWVAWDEAVLDRLDISQSSRWYHPLRGDPPIPPQEIIQSSANMHMIPSDRTVASLPARGEAGPARAHRWLAGAGRCQRRLALAPFRPAATTPAAACEVVCVPRFRANDRGGTRSPGLRDDAGHATVPADPRAGLRPLAPSRPRAAARGSTWSSSAT